MEMRKNEKFTVRIQDISEDGAGIGKVEGYIWFIKDTVIGDLHGCCGYWSRRPFA